ncbi:hypothetical protein ACFXAF_19350 [Kitasatospora sp. NPDC059463]|uniref:hypothetical protein n=1 Tax=unclassified Kitasatospora TaxID=2633591 RepID=UPI0036A5FF12
MPEPITIARFPKSYGTTASAWTQAPDQASRVLLLRAGFRADGSPSNPIYTVKDDEALGGANSRIRLAERMLTEAGYPTQVFPPWSDLELTHSAPSAPNWGTLKTYFVSAASYTYSVETLDDLREMVEQLTAPDNSVLERITALLDTAAHRATSLPGPTPAAHELAQALSSASTALTEAAHLIAATAPHAAPASTLSDRAEAARTCTAETRPSTRTAETFPHSTSPTAQRSQGTTPTR